MNEYKEIDVDSSPTRANIISSHHFFGIEKDGEARERKLKCRLLPRGNRDGGKLDDEIDTSMAHFPVIRLVLSFEFI